MIAYVDSSVLLRVALGQPNALPEWRDIERGVSSALVMTESLRTLDRVRLRVNLSDIEVARRRATILALIDSLELVEIDKLRRGGIKRDICDIDDWFKHESSTFPG
jgi:predicted nucleic acid-binding protein